MDILAKRLVRIARELTDDEFKEQYGIYLTDYEEAVDNPIYGFLVYNKMTSAYWAYCSDSRENAVDVGQKVVVAIKNGGDELNDVLDELASTPGVELVGEDIGNLFYVHSKDRSFIAEINGEYRLVDVVGRFSERF